MASSPPNPSSLGRSPSSATAARSESRASNVSLSKTPLETLLRMGFNRKRALKALSATGASGKGHSAAQIASDWLMAHAHDQTLDDPCPRHFHLHICPGPGTPLHKNLQTFWDASVTQIGWNGAHNSFPHITLVAGLAVPDEKVEEFVTIAKRVWNQFHPDLVGLSEITFEKYVSPNFLGFFVGKNEEIILRSFVQALADEVREQLNLHIDFKGNSESKSSFHLTLAYQFLQKHFDGLQDLAASVDVSVKGDWELRLYSCDERMAMLDTNAYRVLRAQKHHNAEELELIQGDYIYISEDSWSSSDSWVCGTSWLTGQTGFLPKNFVAQTAETHTWTVHLALPLSGQDMQQSSSTVLTSSTSTASLDRLKELASAVTNSSWTLNSTIIDQELAPTMSNHKQSTTSLASGATNMSKKKSFQMQIQNRTPRKIFVVRHGERVDFTFNNWIQHCFDQSSQYLRKDLNMPKSVPLRHKGPEGFARDCPLTVMGTLQASLVGEAMKEAGIIINHVYCSPSLRCIQTAHSLLKSLGALELPIHVEPGLFEWLAWYQDAMPDFMTDSELAQAGYNIQLSYKPYIGEDELRDTQAQGMVEGCEAYYTRNFFVTQCVLASTEDIGGDVLFVGHASTLDACAQQLIGNEPRPMQDMMNVVRKVSYCGAAMLQEEEIPDQTGKRPWKLKEPPFPPLTHCSNARFDVKSLMVE